MTSGEPLRIVSEGPGPGSGDTRLVTDDGRVWYTRHTPFGAGSEFTGHEVRRRVGDTLQ